MATDFLVSQGKIGVGIAEQLSLFTVKGRPSFTLTGTVAKTAASVTVVGTGTAFLTEIAPGDRILVPGDADETMTVVEVASNTSLTVDGAFENTASGQTATCFPAIARFESNDGLSPVVISHEGYVGIGTLGTAPSDNPALLRLHAPSQLPPFSLVFSNNKEDIEGGIALWLDSTDGLKELVFQSMGDDAALFTLGKQHGIVLGVGVRVFAPYVDANYPLTSLEYTVYADAGSGGITLTLPPVAGHDGRVYFVFKTAGAGNVSVAPDGSELINGTNANKTISTQWSGLQLCCVEQSGGWIAIALTAA
jgi:hypothetical protein